MAAPASPLSKIAKKLDALLDKSVKLNAEIKELSALVKAEDKKAASAAPAKAAAKKAPAKAPAKKAPAKKAPVKKPAEAPKK